MWELICVHMGKSEYFMHMVNWELLTQSENSFLDISRGKRVRLNKQFNNRALQTSYRHTVFPREVKGISIAPQDNSGKPCLWISQYIFSC